MIAHPVADIFPHMSSTEYAALRDDIAANGQREPIWTWNDQIIDGRHREQACAELGIACGTQRYQGDESSLVSFCWSLNAARRHLSKEQMAISLARAREIIGHGGDRRSAEFKAQICALKSEQERAGVSDRTVDSARRVVQDGAPELVQAVERGDVSVSAAAQVATLPKDVQADIVATGPAEVVEVAKTIKSGPHVANNSGNNEWYTPEGFINAARAVMGSIDVDPASSEVANRRVQAKTFFTAADNGLLQKWAGNVWMNPPYAQPLVADFTAALIEKYRSEELAQACVLVNNATDTTWFRLLAENSSATCFTKGRVRFIDPEGNPSGAPLQGQAILYFGPHADAFAAEFRRLGYVFVGQPVALAA